MIPLHKDRCFDSDSSVRRIARKLYAETRDLPIVSPHGHVDPRLLADNEPFPEPTALIVAPDHYILRMLYSRGIPLEKLGVPRRDAGVVERDPRRVWSLFAEHYSLFRGTPSGIWLDHTLSELFKVRKPLDAKNALRVYDEVLEKLESPEFLPRALYDRFKIEALATTDAATAMLEHHAAIKRSGWSSRVIPTFRPDALFRIAAPEWRAEIVALAAV